MDHVTMHVCNMISFTFHFNSEKLGHSSIAVISRVLDFFDKIFTLHGNNNFTGGTADMPLKFSFA